MLIRVLGPVGVAGEDGQETPVPGAQTRTLLAVLAAHAGRVVPADRLIDALWGDTPPANAANALQAQVSRLRRVLVRADAAAQLAAVPPGYLLDGADVDAALFTRLVGQARAAADAGDVARAAAVSTEAEQLWRDRAYGDLADHPALRAEASRLDEMRVAAAEDRYDAWLALGRTTDALPALRADVARHPLRERLRALLVRALYAGGRQAEALAAYEEARRTLAEELGVDPGPELRAAHAAVLRQDPAGPAARLHAPGGLPVRLTSFVGRDAELADLIALLDRARLVTVTGPGGAGKTSLAIRAAAVRLDGDPATWAAFADLSPLTDGAAIDDAIARAVGLDPTPSPPTGARGDATPTRERVFARLAAEPLLLVVDNCEHVLDSAANFVLAAMAHAPEARVVATSREPLGLPGEHLLPLGPLPEGDAVRLFAERARSVDPAFALDEATEPVVRHIVRRLDGIPLAVELAAARSRALTPAQIAERLDDRFRLLTGGGRAVLPRQRTLRATVDWSYDLLTGDERTLFEHSALLPGGTTVAVAEAVAAQAGLDPAAALDALARLVDRSLLTRDPQAIPTRYRMLDTFRAYGADRLAARGDLDAARGRVARVLAGAAGRASARLWGPEQGQALDLLEAEFENLRVARAWALRHDPELAVAIAGSVGWFGYLRGHRDEVWRWLRDALDLPAGDAAARAHALVYAGFLAQYEADLGTASDLGEQAVAAYDALGDVRGGAEARLMLAVTAGAGRDLGRTRALLAVAQRAFAERGDTNGIAATHLVEGGFATLVGDWAGAVPHLEEAERLFEGLGNTWGLAYALEFLAVLDESTGRYAEAARRRERVLELSLSRGLTAMAAAMHGHLGNVAVLTGRRAEATRHYADGLEFAQRSGSRDALAFIENGLGFLARNAGDAPRALAHHRTALAFYEGNGMADGAAYAAASLALAHAALDPPDLEPADAFARRALGHARRVDAARTTALPLECLALVAATAGDGVHGGRLLGVADGLRARVGIPLPPAERADRDRAERLAVESIGAERYGAAYREGAAADPGAVVDAELTTSTWPEPAAGAPAAGARRRG